MPVVGYRTDEFPAFWSRGSGLRVPLRLDDPDAVARLVGMQRRLGLAAGGTVAASLTFCGEDGHWWVHVQPLRQLRPGADATDHALLLLTFERRNPGLEARRHAIEFARAHGLTPTQCEILGLLAQGCGNRYEGDRADFNRL